MEKPTVAVSLEREPGLPCLKADVDAHSADARVPQASTAGLTTLMRWTKSMALVWG